MQDCVFCKIVDGQASANVVFEDESVIVILDKDPITKGHCLVITKRNVRDFISLESVLAGKVMAAVSKVADLIKKTFRYDGVMITSVSAKFQDVPHFHIHVFGRDSLDDVQILYPAHQHDLETLDGVADELRKNLI